MTRHRSSALLGLALALLLAACGPAASSGTQRAIGPTSTPGDGATAPAPGDEPGASPQPAATPESEPLAYRPVEIPDAGLSLQVPAAWARLENLWAWSPDRSSLPRAGVHWAELRAPAEPEAAFLPTPSQVLSSDPVSLSWGTGRRVTVEVYGTGPAGADGKVPVESVETHVLIVVRQGETRRGYDLYLAARDSEQLGELQPVLSAMLASARLGSPAGEIGPAHPDWAAYTSRQYRVTLEYPAGWQAVPGEDEKHAGPDGFFLPAAVSGGGQSLTQVCDGEAHHVLQPYGTRPALERGAVAGQEACWILPSADQPAGMGGQAALIVRYPQPVAIGGQPYEFLILWADRAHIRAIGATLAFLPGSE